MKGRKFYIRTEIVPEDILWLIGKETMSRTEMKIHMRGKTVDTEVLGSMIVKLREDSKGHLRMPTQRWSFAEEQLLEGLRARSNREKEKG